MGGEYGCGHVTLGHEQHARTTRTNNTHHILLDLSLIVVPKGVQVRDVRAHRDQETATNTINREVWSYCTVVLCVWLSLAKGGVSLSSRGRIC
jgi:hypothetical protein